MGSDKIAEIILGVVFFCCGIFGFYVLSTGELSIEMSILVWPGSIFMVLFPFIKEPDI